MTAFSENSKWGIYSLGRGVEEAAIQAIASERGFAFYVFDGSKIHDMDDFLDQFEEVMRPIDYGRNWNSFEEMIQTTEWSASPGIVLLYRDFHNFKIGDQFDFDILIDILKTAVEFRRKRVEHPKVNPDRIKPLYIFMQGDESLDLPPAPLI